MGRHGEFSLLSNSELLPHMTKSTQQPPVIQRGEPVYKQVQTHLRELISSGRYPAGAKFPTNIELTESLKVPVSTVNMAMGSLVKEGLLTRRQGVGTFVSARKGGLRRIGVYFLPGVFANTTNIFAHGVYQQLAAQLAKRRVELRTFVDSRPGNKRNECWDELREEAISGGVDGIIAPVMDYPGWEWFGKLPVPLACVGTGTMSCKIDFDNESLVDLCLAPLAKAGRRRVALISPLSHYEKSNPDGSRHKQALLADTFRFKARALGMEIVSGLDDPGVKDPITTEKAALSEFNRIWDAEQRPDGLVVMPDSIAKGAIAASLERRVDVAKELTVVIVKNAELELVCPFPATFVTISMAEAAAALIKMVELQRGGGKPQPMLIPYR